jgi:hypothetical protein
MCIFLSLCKFLYKSNFKNFIYKSNCVMVYIDRYIPIYMFKYVYMHIRIRQQLEYKLKSKNKKKEKRDPLVSVGGRRCWRAPPFSLGS